MRKVFKDHSDGANRALSDNNSLPWFPFPKQKMRLHSSSLVWFCAWEHLKKALVVKHKNHILIHMCLFKSTHHSEWALFDRHSEGSTTSSGLAHFPSILAYPSFVFTYIHSLYLYLNLRQTSVVILSSNRAWIPGTRWRAICAYREVLHVILLCFASLSLLGTQILPSWGQKFLRVPAGSDWCFVTASVVSRKGEYGKEDTCGLGGCTGRYS